MEHAGEIYQSHGSYGLLQQGQEMRFSADFEIEMHLIL